MVAAELASKLSFCAEPLRLKVAALLASAVISRISTSNFTVAALETWIAAVQLIRNDHVRYP